MRAAVALIVFLLVIGSNAKSSSGSRGSSSSRSSGSSSSSSRSSGSSSSSSRSSGSSGSSYGSRSYGSSGTRYTSTYVSSGTVSRSVGLSSYNSFAAGAALGYVAGSSNNRPYYYGYQSYHYRGSYDFGESVCKSTVSQTDIQPVNTSIVADTITTGQVVVYWACTGNEYCCGLDCCPNNSFSVTNCIVVAIFVVIMVLCCCGTYKKCKRRGEKGIVITQQQSTVSYSSQVRPLQPSTVYPPYGMYPQQFVPPPQVPGSYPAYEPPPPPMYHQQAPHAPFAVDPLSQKMSDPYQPAAFYPVQPHNPQGIATVSSPLPPMVPNPAQLYPSPHIAEQNA